MPSDPDVTQLLSAWSAGDDAALERVAPVIQRELHRLAAHYMAGERPGHVLQSTALVNEAYLRLIGWKQLTEPDLVVLDEALRGWRHSTSGKAAWSNFGSSAD
jgi:hypothetical protein